MIVEITGVQHNHQGIRAAVPGKIAQDNIAGDGFVKAVRVQAIRAGQIDHFDRTSIGKQSTAGFTFDCYAGIICNFLPRTGQRIEQRAFTRIRITNQCDERRHLRHADISQSIAEATFVRKATVIRPMRTANGSRHINMPLCNASIVTPGSKPSARKRWLS